MRLLLRRSRPDVLLLQISPEVVEFIDENGEGLNGISLVGVGTSESTTAMHDRFDAIVEGECSGQQLAETFGHLQSRSVQPAPAAEVASNMAVNAVDATPA